MSHDVLKRINTITDCKWTGELNVPMTKVYIIHMQAMSSVNTVHYYLA